MSDSVKLSSEFCKFQKIDPTNRAGVLAIIKITFYGFFPATTLFACKSMCLHDDFLTQKSIRYIVHTKWP